MSRVPCRVCGKSYDGTTHCSVIACRACAMFFKRSETWDSDPVCKNGRKECKLDKAGKITCAYCRYQKCIDAGMKREKNCRSLKSKKTQVEKDNDSPTEIKKEIIELPVLTLETMPVLKRFCYFYAQTSINKKRNEHSLLQASGVPLTELPGNRLMGHITQELCGKIMCFDINEFSKLMNGAFPAYGKVGKSFQDAFIYVLMFPLLDLTSSFRTLRAFNDTNSSIILITDALYCNLDDISQFFDPSDFSNPMDYETVKYYVRIWWKSYLNSTQKLMHLIKLTDVEYLAVCALTIMDEDNFAQDEKLSLMAETYRTLIYKDLDYYYKNVLHMDNYVERVMHFKELNRTLKANLYSVRETFHFLRTFNFYKASEELGNAANKILHVLDNQFEAKTVDLDLW